MPPNEFSRFELNADSLEYPSNTHKSNAYTGSITDQVMPQTIMPPAPSSGRILLVGAGPGDPDLLTMAAHKALCTADIVISDRLIPQVSGSLLGLWARTTVFMVSASDRYIKSREDRGHNDTLHNLCAGCA
jgi:hypothetical protein